MKSLNQTTSANRNAPREPARKSRLDRVGRIIVLLWVVGLIAFLVIVKLVQEASFGPLQRAAWHGDLPIVQWLVQQGTAVDEGCDFHRWTALHVVAHKGRFEIAEFLIKKGANIDARDKDGYTPLHNTADSVLKGFPPKRTEEVRNRIAALLLKHGAYVNATTNHGETPLHGAALTNNVRLAELFIENGADPNVQQAQGMTPLHFALFAGKDRLQVVHQLLAHGADSSIRDEYGRTPTDYAKDYHPKLLELLGE